MNLGHCVSYVLLLGLNICQTVTQQLIPCMLPTCDIPPPNCRIVQDPTGCPTCNYVCEYGPFICPEIQCQNFCLDGYAMDPSGCQSCNCNTLYQQPVQALAPHINCPMWQQCVQGLCPNSCNCFPNCGGPGGRPYKREREGIHGEEPYEF